MACTTANKVRTGVGMVRMPVRERGKGAHGCEEGMDATEGACTAREGRSHLGRGYASKLHISQAFREHQARPIPTPYKPVANFC
jgi:hypothetical protein